MRKTFILTLVLCVAAAIAYAQTGTGTSGTTTTTTAPATTGTTGTTTTTTTHHKGHKPAAHKTVKGTVASVTPPDTFVVHPAKGDDVTLKTNAKTKYTPKTCNWDAIKVDAKVTVTYHNDGKDNWALTVHCWPPPKTTGAAATAAPKTGK